MPTPLNRRELVERCLSAGALVLAPTVSLAAAMPLLADEPARAVTPPNVLGPFYKRKAPRTAALAPSDVAGVPLSVEGVVCDTRGALLEGALLEVWHASSAGLYDNDGYLYRGEIEADAKGAYAFRTVLPGHYPGRVCQHVHYRVTAPGHKPLVTQLYFATDPAFDGDPDRNFRKDPLITSRELVRPVALSADGSAVRARVRFEVCLERA
ncbi:MAG TPA: intradiol ring-cleavage dioxygenase [Thermoanaerobaculia bacterium]|nr:intradiol ring-cleavage dioxygenase [Thermoanaerobaculia bacterium]